MKFGWGDTNRYGHLLVLDAYAYPVGQEQFALPVEDPVKTPDWTEWTLLGAPEAFLRKRELVVKTTKLDFASHIPDTVRKEVRSYFEGKRHFKSFACLLVVSEGTPAGIVNVESADEDIFQALDETQNRIAQLLQPFCAVLSLVIKVEV